MILGETEVLMNKGDVVFESEVDAEFRFEKIKKLRFVVKAGGAEAGTMETTMRRLIMADEQTFQGQLLNE